ncbi:MAG: hypothetical protein E7168_00450 [Firmicutes bacterium]|nr:hypothetical protein [Bacillota bacterium]
MENNEEIYQLFLKDLNSCSDEDFYKIVEKYFLIFKEQANDDFKDLIKDRVDVISKSKDYLLFPARGISSIYRHSFYFNLGSIRKALGILEEFPFSTEEKLLVISTMLAWGCRLENLVTLTQNPNIIWYDCMEYFYYGLFTSKLSSNDYDWFYPILMLKSVREKVCHLPLDDKKKYIHSLYCYFSSFFETNNNFANDIRNCCDMNYWNHQQITLDNSSMVLLENHISNFKKLYLTVNK